MEYFVSAKIYKEGELRYVQAIFDGIVSTDSSQNIINNKREILVKKIGDESLLNTIRRYILIESNHTENYIANIIAFNNIK